MEPEQHKKKRIKETLEQNEKNHPKSNENEEGLVSIFVHGLHPFTTKKDIEETFMPICQLRNLQFRKNKYTGKHKGYAFFDVDSMDIANKLINMSHTLHDRKIHCDFKNNDPEEKKLGERKRVFVGGLSKETTNDDLAKVFKKFGTVRAAYTIKNLEGESKGFGYVDYFTVSAAKAAATEGKVIINGRKVDVRAFKRKEETKSEKKVWGNVNFNQEGRVLNSNPIPVYSCGYNPVYEDQFFAQMMMMIQFGGHPQPLRKNHPGQTIGNFINPGGVRKFQGEALVQNQGAFTTERRLQNEIMSFEQSAENPAGVWQENNADGLGRVSNAFFGPSNELRTQKMALDRLKKPNLEFEKPGIRNTLKEILETGRRMKGYEQVRKSYFFRYGSRNRKLFGRDDLVKNCRF